MKIIVLGSAGQLGRDLCPRLVGEVVPLTRAEIDLTDAASLQRGLESHRADVVVNCAAYNFVDKAEGEPNAAFAVNAWAVRDLAIACKATGATLVHISSDYVFGLDAARSSPFAETDAAGPVSVYGVSKLTGEYMARTHAPRHLVIRTCGLYGVWGSGGKGGNFVETMLRVAAQGKPLRVVNDQHCTPSYTVDVAAAIADLIHRGATGLFHVTNDGATTWHDLAAEIFRLSGTPADLTPIPSAEYVVPAKRPPYSVLALDKLAAAGVPCPRPWQDALAAYLYERARRS